MHFNAAMLELHSRLHHLDVQREQRQLRRKREEEARAIALAAERALQAQAHTSLSPTAAAAAAADPAAAAVAAEPTAKENSSDGEEEDQEGWTDAASDQQVSAWFDDAQWQQKEAKAAVLAIRKHLRSVLPIRWGGGQLLVSRCRRHLSVCGGSRKGQAAVLAIRKLT